MESSGQPLAIQGWLPTTDKVGGGPGEGYKRGVNKRRLNQG